MWLPIPSLLRLLALTGERAGTEFASNSEFRLLLKFGKRLEVYIVTIETVNS